MKPVALYSRVSTQLQALDGMSLEQQERAIRSYCAAQGWPEPAEYVDAGRSAYREEVRHRPQFARLLDHAEAGAIGTIVVWHLNRWARKTRVTLETLDRMQKAGVSVISLSQNLDYTSAVGKLTITMLAGIAQFESDEKSETAKRVRAALIAQGKWPAGKPPWGARLDPDGRLMVDPCRAPDLKRLLFHAAHWSDTRVAALMDETGVPPPGTAINSPRTNPVRWWPRSVRAIVRDGDWLLTQPEPWPGLWLAAHNRPRKPPVGKTKTIRTLSGLLRCASCGGAVVYGRTRGVESTRWLRCIAPGCKRHHGPAIPHEEAVVCAAMALVPRPHPEPANAFDATAWAALIEDRRRVARLYQDSRSGMTDAEYEAAMAALDAREAALTAAGSPARDVGDIAAVLPVLDRHDPAERNAVLRHLIARVEIDRASRRITWLPITPLLFAGCA